MTRRLALAAIAAAAQLAGLGRAGAAPCGSALLLEVAAPAAIAAIDPTLPVFARFWQAGAGGANRSDAGCQAGCTLATGAACAGGGNCLALTGVNWLNAICATPGQLPARTIFLVEQTTTGSGGRWAAINLDHNASDANTDLDAKSAAVCAGCASTVSPYLGGSGFPEVTSFSLSADLLGATLSWSVPPAAARALSNGPELVTSFAVYYKAHSGPPPAATGDPTGWTRLADLEPDGVALGGYSTNTSASVQVPLSPGIEALTFAIGLSLDGSGNPATDPNTLASRFLSDQSAAVNVELLIFADDFELGQTSRWVTGP